MNISLLAAYTDKNRVIGNNGKIPWNLPSERNRFKKICNNKYVIMGRKTFKEIDKALPYCTIIIVSKSMQKAPEGCILVSSLKAAINKIQSENNKNDVEILVAGGQSIYEQMLPFANKIYATEIHYDFEGNSFFPEISNDWERTIIEKKSEMDIYYDYVEYKRNIPDLDFNTLAYQL